MPLSITLGDLAETAADVLVNSAHPKPIIGTGVERALYERAGLAMLSEREAFGPLNPGTLFKSHAYDLDATHVYHVLTPDYTHPEAAEALGQIYDMCLNQAAEDGAESIAFPLLGSGNHVFPKATALQVARTHSEAFLKTHDLSIMIVVFVHDDFQIPSTPPRFEPASRLMHQAIKHEALQKDAFRFSPEEGFQPMLFRFIDARSLDDVTVYKRANISRKVFSKIRSNPAYQPSKKTAISLAIGLKLSLDETLDLMQAAGYTLSNSLLFDRIVSDFITRGEDDILTLNETLFYYDQTTL